MSTSGPSVPPDPDAPDASAGSEAAGRGDDDPGSRLGRILEQQGLAPARPEPDPSADDPVESLLAEHRTAEEVEGGPGAEGSSSESGPASTAGGDAGADGDSDPDEAPLPDAPLFALLRSLEADVGIDRIDRVWVFPPRRLEAGETSVVVVAAFPGLDEHRRRVYAAHYTAPADAKDARLALDEFGTAPTERVGRLVEDVVERLKDEPAAPPKSFRIEGEDRRWRAALHELAEAHLEEATKDRRLR